MGYANDIRYATDHTDGRTDRQNLKLNTLLWGSLMLTQLQLPREVPLLISLLSYSLSFIQISYSVLVGSLTYPIMQTRGHDTCCHHQSRSSRTTTRSKHSIPIHLSPLKPTLISHYTIIKKGHGTNCYLP